MPRAHPTRPFEIVTAVMLGLVSIVTALGAWQASVWNTQATELAGHSGDARDVSVSQAVLADYSRRVDSRASLNAQRFEILRQASTGLEQLLYQSRIDIELGKATSGFDEVWRQWAAAGFPADADPLDDAGYTIARDRATLSYGYVSRVAAQLASSVSAKSGILAQAALIQALALFVFGISGLNRNVAVRAGVLGLGIAVFLAGLALAVTAY